jgi:hypothetical protein
VARQGAAGHAVVHRGWVAGGGDDGRNAQGVGRRAWGAQLGDQPGVTPTNVGVWSAMRVVDDSLN